MKNLTLFSNEPDPLIVDPTRPDPALWVRQLVILESLASDARVIRRIEFRRGLNIINTAIHPGDDTATVGHSVGKTLLLRLIRYCLGERNFGSPAVRQAIAERFHKGYVLADVAVAGVPWVVARPIGIDAATHASFTMPEATIDSFLNTTTRRDRFTAFAEELRRQIVQPLGSAKLPRADRNIEWLDVLPWLSRDQACRHRSHTEWRPPGPDSHGLKIEDCHVVIRTFMDLLSPEDTGLIVNHKQLLRRRGRLLHTIETERSVLARRQAELVGALEIKDVSSEYELFAAAAEANARDKKGSLERFLDDEISKSPLPEVESQYSDVVKEIGALDQVLKSLRENEKATENQILQLERASTESILLQLAEQGEWCHLFDTKAEAVAQGCPATNSDRQGIDDPHRERKLRDLRQDLANVRTQIGEESERLTLKQIESERLRNEVQKEQARVEKLRGPLRQRIERYALLEEAAKAYGKQSAELHRLIDSGRELKADVDNSLQDRKQADARFRLHLNTITNCFRNVLGDLLGHSVEARIELNAQGIFPRPANTEGIRGAAIGTSTTVLGFDLACLAASICGVGHHPRFLLHDSPREADMEEPMYHRLFRLVRSLERLFGERLPSFQYIVTTTTPPPSELAGKDSKFVRMTLDKRRPDGLLLNETF